jgi:D-glycero-alpha-D-manno-heptose-7-phosphate kinase
MIVVKTPYRISFFGGGTDYPSYYKEFGGQVLSATFNKYCYISVRNLPPFFAHKHRIVYSQVENVVEISDIEHSAVRAVLGEFDDGKGYEVHHDGDLPARSGLGSSSSFLVGLVHAMRALKGDLSSKNILANEALRFEQDVLKENVGSQDQIATAYGGLNKIQFFQSGAFNVNPIVISKEKKEHLEENLMLFFTGVSRNATEIVKEQLENTKNNTSYLLDMFNQVDEAIDIISNETRELDDFGRLLHEGWMIKRGLSTKISNSFIDSIYDTARKNGALGGKLLGAGGGGFVLFYVNSEYQQGVLDALSDLVYIPFHFENSGSSIVVYEPE